MSFANYKEVIEEGDSVILYMSNYMHAIEVLPEIKNKNDVMVENVFQTNFGALKVRGLIGKRYGQKVELSKGWAHVLQPTPELWTLTLPHRTQIIYTPDISMILHQLEIKPGSIVIEAGTGSGSLSHAFIRAVKPTGHLYTFDFHENRVNVAAQEFKDHGLADFVTAKHNDVCANGFGDELNEKADAVFLDLPHPWLGVPHVVKTLKTTGGRFCSFSPCIEQVQRTYDALDDNDFTEIKTMEVLQTEYKIASRPLQVKELDFLKHKWVIFVNWNNDMTGGRRRTLTRDRDGCRVGKEAYLLQWAYIRRIENFTSTKTEGEDEKSIKEIQYITASAPQTMPGHTGYLTVATLPPIWSRTSKITPSAYKDVELAFC